MVAYLETSSPTDAYKASYTVANMKPRTITRRAVDVLQHPNVAAAIQQHREAQAANVNFGVQSVLREWIDIATADAGDLMAHRRVNCRRCWGHAHNHQWRDAAEFTDALAMTMDFNAGVRHKSKRRKLPTDEGGYGFNGTLSPNPECPYCDGDGKSDVWFADTRKLTGKARKLFAGVKQTKDGIQIITRDQDAALTNLAKALGIMAEKVVFAGDNDQPDMNKTFDLPADPQEAARMYSQFMKGGK